MGKGIEKHLDEVRKQQVALGVNGIGEIFNPKFRKALREERQLFVNSEFNETSKVLVKKAQGMGMIKTSPGKDKKTTTNKGEKKMEQKTGGFFSRVNAALGLAYELASLYSEAKKKEKESPEAVKALTTSEKYQRGLGELNKKLGEFDTAGFVAVRKTGVERYLKGVIAERGVLTLLDREAKRRYENKEKVKGRPLSPFAPAFKNAFNELPLSLKEEEGIYPTISHSMFLKTEGALKKIGKFQAAMELAERVPEKWRKPFEIKETSTVPTSETPTTPPVIETPVVQ